MKRDTIPVAAKQEKKGSLLMFNSKQRIEMTDKLKRYSSQTLALSDEEKEIIEILYVVTGIKKATLSRSLFYRGLADFLKDRSVVPDRSEGEIFNDLVKLTHTDPKLRAARQIVEARSEQIPPRKASNSR
jgi:hypothetical protein